MPKLIKNGAKKARSSTDEAGVVIQQSWAICQILSENPPPRPENVVNALKGIKHVLIGGFAIPTYTGKARATMDVDVVVNDLPKARKAISIAFVDLKESPNPGEDVTRFHDKKGTEVINLLHPVGVFKFLLNHIQFARIAGQKIPVSTFEALLVSKFLSLHSPHRDPSGKRRDDMDLTDLIFLIP